MVKNWKSKINKLKTSESDFLPFDYSDQYVGFFLISRISSENISIQAAFTMEYQGWGINPSQLYLANLTDKSYKLNDKKYVLFIDEFLQDIETSITNIFSSFYRRALLK